jgi:hypothetical protein
VVEPVVSVKKGAASLLAVCLCLLVAIPGAAAGKDKNKSYRPPYKKGPSGGDAWNYVHSDPQSGEMAVFRVFPGIPPVVGCAPEPSAGWAMFRVKHRVAEPVDAVELHYEAFAEPYTWITVGVRGADGDWLGVRKSQGPHYGDGKLIAKVFDKPQRGDIVWIEFGLQLGDACPQVGGGAATFPRVVVRT